MGYNGKHARKTNDTGMKKSAVLLAALMLIFTVSVGATLAYVIDKDGPITNIFKPSHVACEVVEDNFTATSESKTNVKIQNTGDTDAYIRAAVVVTWKDTEGNVYGQLPKTDEYTISYNLTNGWAKGSDGYYYWTAPVAAKTGQTGVLISSCTPVAGKAPSGYNLSVEIVAEAIQSVPVSVVADKWASGVSSVSGTTLQIKQ